MNLNLKNFKIDNIWYVKKLAVVVLIIMCNFEAFIIIWALFIINLKFPELEKPEGSKMLSSFLHRYALRIWT